MSKRNRYRQGMRHRVRHPTPQYDPQVYGMVAHGDLFRERLVRTDIAKWFSSRRIRFSGDIFRMWLDTGYIKSMSDYRVDIKFMNPDMPKESRGHFRECRAGRPCWYASVEGTIHLFFGTEAEVLERFYPLLILKP